MPSYLSIREVDTLLDQMAENVKNPSNRRDVVRDVREDEACHHARRFFDLRGHARNWGAVIPEDAAPGPG